MVFGSPQQRSLVAGTTPQEALDRLRGGGVQGGGVAQVAMEEARARIHELAEARREIVEHSDLVPQLHEIGRAHV